MIFWVIVKQGFGWMTQEQQEDRHEFSPSRFIELFSKASDLDERIVPVITYLNDVVNGTSPFEDMLEASGSTKKLIDDARNLASVSKSEYIRILQDMVGYLTLSQYVLSVECTNVGKTVDPKEYRYTIDIKTPNFQQGDAVRDPALAIIEILKWIDPLKQPLVDGSDVKNFMGSLAKIDLPAKTSIGNYNLVERNGVYRVVCDIDENLTPIGYSTIISYLAKLAKATGVRFQFPYEPHEPKPF